MNGYKTVSLTRDVEATMIPAGTPVTIPQGTEVTITQSLGGTYTVVGPGVMARIEGRNADALGIESSEKVIQPNTAGEHTGPIDADAVWDQLKTCYDPEIPVNIVDLGLVYQCELSEAEAGQFDIKIKMTLTAPGCGMGPVLASDVKMKVESLPGVRNADV